MITISPPEPLINKTKAYADDLWANNPKISPSSWREFSGYTVGKIAGRVASPFLEQQKSHLVPALQGGVNLWFLEAVDISAQKVFYEALAQSGVSREAIVIVYEYPLCAGAQLDIELDLLPSPNGIIWTSQKKVVSSISNKNSVFTAFLASEKACKAGKIDFYGLAHAGFSLAEKDAFCVDLDTVLILATQAAKQVYARRKRSHFRLVACPINVLELGALRYKNATALLINKEEKVSFLELAVKAGLFVMAERPLTASLPNGPLWLTKNDNTAPLYAALQERIPTDWKKQSLSAICLTAITSLPGVGSAVTLPGVDIFSQDIIPLFERPDFADVGSVVGC